MDIFSVFTFAGGLALFLYGMNIMGKSLEKQAGGRFKSMLERITSNPSSGVLLGMGITAIIQSSSATTVMVVGLVNSGIMTLENSVGVIMGANIGTTVTAWIISLIGIESSNFFIQMFKPANFSPILAVIGICMLMFAKRERKKEIGHILLGFAVLMFGMTTMSDAVKPLADVPEFINVLTMFSNPALGILAGALITGVIQSSSASVGILQAMSMTGSITFGVAIPILMGQHIGTCVTALISSIGANANAKRAAMIHLLFNVLGVIAFSIIFYLLDALIGWAFLDSPINVAQIAIVHTFLSLFNTALFLPLNKQLVRLVRFTVKDSDSEEKFQLLDERLLRTPAFAVVRCRGLTDDMAALSREMLLDSINTLRNFSEASSREILEKEEKMDQYEDKLGTYMVRLSSRSMSASDSKEVGELLQCIGDFERIADHSVNIMESAEELSQKNLQFSNAASEELKVMKDAVIEIVDLAVTAFIKNDVEIATNVEPLEEVVDMLTVQLKTRHIARLQRNECTTVLGFVFSDLITNFERVADHCSNIALAVLQKHSEKSFDAHKYIQEMIGADNERFSKLHAGYLEKYSLSKSV